MHTTTVPRDKLTTDTLSNLRRCDAPSPSAERSHCLNRPQLQDVARCLAWNRHSGGLESFTRPYKDCAASIARAFFRLWIKRIVVNVDLSISSAYNNSTIYMSLDMVQASKVDLVVVDAGLSGLRTATLLEQHGLSCMVLEEKDRVGDKTLSLSASQQGGKVDVGAAWINDTNQSEMYSLAKQFGFDLIQQRSTGTVIYEGKDGKLISYPYGERIEVRLCTLREIAQPNVDH
jgi:hypothetical protein